MTTKIGRIDRGEGPTVSHNPEQVRPYDRPIKENLYNTDHKIPSELYKKRYDEIRWDDDEGNDK